MMLIFSKVVTCNGQSSGIRTLNISGSVGLNAGFIQNNHYGHDGFVSSLIIDPQIAVHGVPLSLKWNALYAKHSGFQFGRIGLSFSKSAFADYLKLTKVNNSMREGADTLNELRNVTAKLSDINYMRDVSNANVAYRKLRSDSLKGTMTAADEIKMDSLRQIISEYESLNNRFHKLKQYPSQALASANGLGKNDTLKFSDADVQKYRNQPENIADSLDDLKQLPKLNRYQRLFEKFEKISIGYGILDFTRFSVTGYPYTGAGVEYNYKSMIAGVTYGKHRSYYNTSVMNVYSIPGSFTDQPAILHLKAGLGDADNQSILGFTKFNSSTSAKNGFPDNNASIVNIKARKCLSEQSIFEAEISKSFTGNGISENSSADLKDFAVNIRCENSLAEHNAKFKAEYLNVGSSFYTPGNPYLNSGFQLISMGISKTVLKGKISADLNVSNSWSALNNEDLRGWKRTSLSFSLRNKLNRSISTYWRHFAHSFVSMDSQKQNSESEQLICTILTGNASSFTVSGFLSKQRQSNRVTSVSYNIASTFSFQKKKNILTVTSAFSSSIAEGHTNSSVSIGLGDKLTVFKKLSIRVNTGANIMKNSLSILLDYALGYSLSNHLIMDLSGGINANHYSTSNIPGYARSNNMLGVQAIF